MRTRWIHRQAAESAERLLPRRAGAGGFSLLELMLVVAIALILVAIALPQLSTSLTLAKWRGEVADLSGVFQSCRSQAIKNNQTEQLNFTTSKGLAVAYLVDLDSVGTNAVLQYGQDATSMQAAQTQVWMFSQFSQVAAPAGTNPPPLDAGTMWGGGSTVLPDTPSPASPSTNNLCFNSRGVPCNCPATLPNYCTAITNGYAFYFQQGSQWAAVGVSPAGRIKTYVWSGSAWAN
jgi:prepilin-type N-terminal cleavage/methylation domain-containing protein